MALVAQIQHGLLWLPEIEGKFAVGRLQQESGMRKLLSWASGNSFQLSDNWLYENDFERGFLSSLVLVSLSEKRGGRLSQWSSYCPLQNPIILTKVPRGSGRTYPNPFQLWVM